MIEGLRTWLQAVAAASLLVSLLRALASEGPVRRAVSFAGGLFLILVLVSPLRQERRLAAGELELWQDDIRRRQEELTAMGEVELRQTVAERTQARIDAQAAALGAEVRSRVSFAPEGTAPIPWSVELFGEPSPELAEWIASELGIPRNRQAWTAPEAEP